MNTLFAQAVAEGKVKGTVYADDPADPQAFYIVHPYGMSLLFGRPERHSFRQKVDEYITNSAGTRPAAEWLQAYPPAWKEVLPSLQGAVEEHVRVNFRLNREAFAEACRARRESTNASVREAERLEREEAMRLRGSVVPGLFWRKEAAEEGKAAEAGRTPEPNVAFAVRGGDGSVASVAFSSCLTHRELEIGIETMEPFRGRGMAFDAGEALIDYCLETGLEPVWACRESNAGSYALACKLGFEPVFTLPYYHLPG